MPNNPEKNIKKEEYKKWKELHGPLADLLEEQEAAEKNNKKEAYKKWKELHGPLADLLEEQEAAEKDLAEAYGAVAEDNDGASAMYVEQNLPGRLKDKEDRWQEEINKATNSRGERLTEAEKRSLLQKFYLEELPNYEIKQDKGIKGALKGIWSALMSGREKVKILKDGKPIERNGKQVEFKINWYYRHPGEDLVEFFKGEVESKIKADLKKEWGVKEENSKEEKKQENIQEAATGKAESENRPLTQTEFFSRYLSANDLDEKDITPEKLQELVQNWKAYRKEIRIKSSKTQTPEAKAFGKTAQKKEGAGGDTKEKPISPLIREKLIKFFEGFKDDRRIKKALEALAVGKVDLAKEQIKRMLEKSEANLKSEMARGNGNPRLIKQHENHIGKLRGFLQEIESPAEKTGLPLRGDGFMASQPFPSETPHKKGIEFRPGETSVKTEEEKGPEEEIKQKVGDIIGIIKQVSRSKEITAGQLSGANERRAEKSPETEEDKASLVSSASSFEELSRAIERIGIIEGSRGGKYSPEKIILDIKDIEEDLIYLIRQGKISPDSPEIEKSLRKFTRSYGLREKIIELLKAETAKVELEKKPPVEQGPEASLDSGRKELDEEELAEERAARQLIKRNKRKKESNKKEKKIGFMERAKVLIENGRFNFKITPELKKFFKDRGYNQEQIRKMSKDPKAAWDEASDIYQKEQKGVAEE